MCLSRAVQTGIVDIKLTIVVLIHIKDKTSVSNQFTNFNILKYFIIWHTQAS